MDLAPDDLGAWAACYTNTEAIRYLPKPDLTLHARAERASSFISTFWVESPGGGSGCVIARKADKRFIS